MDPRTATGPVPGPDFPPLEDRPIKNTICLFDVDGTLTPARKVRPLPLPPPFLSFLLSQAS